MKNYRCTVCSYVYIPAKGDPKKGVEPGTAFEQLPENWKCPRCNKPVMMFEEVDERL